MIQKETNPNEKYMAHMKLVYFTVCRAICRYPQTSTSCGSPGLGGIGQASLDKERASSTASYVQSDIETLPQVPSTYTLVWN